MAITRNTFHYQGYDQQGNIVSGEIRSPSMAQARTQLRKQGIRIQTLQIKPKVQLQIFKRQNIHPLDITVFTRQLATMLQAGIPLLQSLQVIIAGLDHPHLQQLIRQIQTQLENGCRLADALLQHPQHFDHLYCALVQVGEQSGTLELMLQRIALYREKTEILKHKIKKALRYPCVVLFVACVVTAILMVKVVPIFQELFQSFGAELPAFTQTVVNLSLGFRRMWWLYLAILIALPFLILHGYQHFERFHQYLDRISLKLPIVGTLLYKSIVARYSRSLATTFAAGVPLTDALAYTAAITNNAIYQNAVMKIRDDVATGQQLQFAMRNCKLFPSLAIQMVAIGEESGALDRMLDKVATHFESEVDHAVEGLTALIEPLIMIILGILVGSLVIAMYLPIFKMGSVV